MALSQIEKLHLQTASDRIDRILEIAKSREIGPREALASFADVQLYLGRAQGCERGKGNLEVSIDLHIKLTKFIIWVEKRLALRDKTGRPIN